MNPQQTNPHARLISALLIVCGTSTAALADPAGVQVVAMTGTPTANGTMSSFFHQPSIGDGGHIAFHCYMEGTSFGQRDAYGAFRASPGNPAAITEISRSSNALPDANGLMDSPYFSSVNASGAVCGLSFFTATNFGTNDDSGIMMSTGGVPVHIARQGQPLPNNAGTYDVFDSFHINDAGQVTFWADVLGTPSILDSGIFRSFGGTTTTLFRRGDPAPGGIGQFNFIWQDVDCKANGTLAFWANLVSAGDDLHDERIYRYMNGVTTTIAKEGDISPDANGQLWQNNGNFIAVARVSDNGNVAFRADLLGTSGGSSDNAAIYRGTGGPLTMIARKGQLAPDDNGHFSQLYLPDVTNSGRVVFEAVLSGTTGGTADDQAFYSGSGGALTTIFREGQPTPSGDGELTCDFFNWNCNGSGEMALRTNLRNTQSGGDNDNAIYFYRPGSPLLEIVRTGTPMLGSTVKHLNSTDQSYAPSLSPINAAGQIAFYFELEDGRNGIARFTPPPSCLGDFNSDGVRNTIDLTMFLGKFGQMVTPWGIGDMNGDGVVNTLDLTAFLGVFGVPCR